MRRSRPPASTTSTGRAKEILSSDIGIHPLFSNSVSKSELDRDSVLKQLSKYGTVRCGIVSVICELILCLSIKSGSYFLDIKIPAITNKCAFFVVLAFKPTKPCPYLSRKIMQVIYIPRFRPSQTVFEVQKGSEKLPAGITMKEKRSD